jgi:hypothetical protein
VGNDEGVLDVLLMSHEAHFHLSGYVNKQNFRYWSDKNPMQIRGKLSHSEKVTIWHGVSTSVVIGPYFFGKNPLGHYHGFRVLLHYAANIFVCQTVEV